MCRLFICMSLIAMCYIGWDNGKCPGEGVKLEFVDTCVSCENWVRGYMCVSLLCTI